MIDAQKLIELSSYFSIIHHIKGRIRLRVSKKIKEIADKSTLTLDDITNLKDRINGIKSVKINKLVGSITIEYDSTIFPDILWSNLVEQKKLDEIVEIINSLIISLEEGEN